MKKGKKNNNILNIVIFVLIILIIVLSYTLFFGEKNGESKNHYTETETEKTNSTGDVLTIYKYNDEDELKLSKDTNESNLLIPAFTIKVESDKAKVLDIDDTESQFVLYRDNGLYLYTVNNKTSKKLNLEDNYSEYKIELDEAKSNIIGISYINDKKEYAYYNVLKDKKMFVGEFKLANNWYIDRLNDKYISLQLGDDKKVYLLNIDTGNVDLKYETNEERYGLGYGIVNNSGKYIIVLGYGYDGMNYLKFYTSNLKEFYDSSSIIISDSDVSYYNKHIYIGSKKDGYTINEYDFDGQLINSKIIKEFDSIKQLVDDYVLYIKNSNLTIENIDNNNEVKTITSWTDNKSFDYSSYYKKEYLDKLGKSNRQEGIYIIVNYTDKDSSGNYGIEYCYTSSKEIIEYPIKSETGGLND